MLNAISQKRIAFKHEEEVRLIYVDKKPNEDFNSVIETLFTLIELRYGNKTDSSDSVELNKETLLKDLVNFNVCQNTKIHLVPFEHIDNFIKGVMVNPHAPDWYINTIKKYCELNDIPFEGKSDLYQNVNEVNEDE